MTADINAITCQLEVRGVRLYELYIVPHWDPAASFIEQYDEATPARLRHAEAARCLRENGWTVIEQGSTGIQASA